MTDEEMRITIAEACGWIQTPPNRSWPTPFWTDPKSKVLRVFSELPDYLNDLNLMHEVEKGLSLAESIAYMQTLLEEDGEFLLAAWSQVHASARQRARAFLRTIGKLSD
jgi:hypothetical protein